MPLVVNRHARHDYSILEEMEAGLVLTGGEVKSLREKCANIKDAFVRVSNGEAFLVNARIDPYLAVTQDAPDPTRSRKLLLKKRQIHQIEEFLKVKGLSAIPLMVGTGGNYIKVLIGIGKGKKQYEHREELKKKDLQRESERGIL